MTFYCFKCDNPCYEDAFKCRCEKAYEPTQEQKELALYAAVTRSNHLLQRMYGKKDMLRLPESLRSGIKEQALHT